MILPSGSKKLHRSELMQLKYYVYNTHKYKKMFSQEFKEFIQLLNANKVEYLIVGGYAVGIHGYPRFTGDIDIWINPDEKNINKMPAVLEEFGFSSIDNLENDLKNKENIFRIGYPPYRIDIMTDIDGVAFKDCFPNKIVREIDGIKIFFIGFNDLIKNKKASGRNQDLLDLENLQ